MNPTFPPNPNFRKIAKRGRPSFHKERIAAIVEAKEKAEVGVPLTYVADAKSNRAAYFNHLLREELHVTKYRFASAVNKDRTYTICLVDVEPKAEEKG